MKKLNNAEVEDFSDEVYRILKEIPIDYCRRVLERSYEYRKRYDEPELDYSSSEEEDNNVDGETSDSCTTDDED